MVSSDLALIWNGDCINFEYEQMVKVKGLF